MSQGTRTLLVGVVIGIIAIAVLELVTSLAVIFSVITGIIIGAVAVVVMKASASGEDPVEAVRETVQQARAVAREPETTIKERRANEQLMQMSLAFVTSAAAPALVEPLRGLVDELRKVVGRALEFAPASETTFNLVKLATDDLPTQIGYFVDLTPVDRDAKSSTLEEQLNALREKVRKLTEFIDAGRQADFDAQSMFINLKFGD